MAVARGFGPHRTWQVKHPQAHPAPQPAGARARPPQHLRSPIAIPQELAVQARSYVQSGEDLTGDLRVRLTIVVRSLQNLACPATAVGAMCVWGHQTWVIVWGLWVSSDKIGVAQTRKAQIENSIASNMDLGVL